MIRKDNKMTAFLVAAWRHDAETHDGLGLHAGWNKHTMVVTRRDRLIMTVHPLKAEIHITATQAEREACCHALVELGFPSPLPDVKELVWNELYEVFE